MCRLLLLSGLARREDETKARARGCKCTGNEEGSEKKKKQ
jgi:hypothetical protein